MSRLQGILAAGSLTGVVLASSLALGAGKFLQPEQPTPTPIIQVTGGGDGMASSREQQYKTQIEAANATILQLEAQLGAVQQAPAMGAVDNSGVTMSGGEPEQEHPEDVQQPEQEHSQEQESPEGGDD